MELVTAVFTPIMTGIQSVGSALGVTSAPMNLVAGTAAAPAASTGSTALSILQGGLGLMTAMSSVRAGQAKADTYRMQAADTRLAAKDEDIAATDKEASLRKALVASLGERDVAYAASGVDLSFGTPAVARQAAIADADTAMMRSRQRSDLRKSQLMAKADTLDALASDAEGSGALSAFGALAGAGVDYLKRG